MGVWVMLALGRGFFRWLLFGLFGLFSFWSNCSFCSVFGHYARRHVISWIPALALEQLSVVVGLGAGLLLLQSLRVRCYLIFLSLLATVRGGTSFLCQTATKKRSKENAFQPLVLKWPERAVSNCLVLQKNAQRRTPDR
jgi:hypothetical protein